MAPPLPLAALPKRPKQLIHVEGCLGNRFKIRFVTRQSESFPSVLCNCLYANRVNFR